jgi:DNA-binding response OmpR family regulator
MNNNKRILLVVDDEPDITFTFSMGLEDSGFVVDAFNDPLLALEAFKEKKSYDLALIDVKMPKMNGFELCKEIRKINDKVKVCFATAFDIQKEEEEDIKTLAASNEKPIIIRKPILIDDLVKRIKMEIGDS